MNIRRLLSTLLICTVMLLPAFAQKSDPRRDPATTIVEAIKLLESKDYVTLIKTCSRPDDLKEQLERKTIEQMAAEFAERKAAGILEALRAATKMTPVLTQEGVRAEYRFEKPIGGESRIVLVKIGEHWYLR